MDEAEDTEQGEHEVVSGDVVVDHVLEGGGVLVGVGVLGESVINVPLLEEDDDDGADEVVASEESGEEVHGGGEGLVDSGLMELSGFVESLSGAVGPDDDSDGDQEGDGGDHEDGDHSGGSGVNVDLISGQTHSGPGDQDGQNLETEEKGRVESSLRVRAEVVVDKGLLYLHV